MLLLTTATVKLFTGEFAGLLLAETEATAAMEKITANDKVRITWV